MSVAKRDTRHPKRSACLERQGDQAEQPAKTCEPGEGTEPVARLCWQRSEKEPEQPAKTCEPGEGTEPVARLCRQRRRRASGASDKGRWATDGRCLTRPPHHSKERSSLQRRAIRARAPSPSHVFAACGAKKPRSTGSRCVAETSVASQLHILTLSEGAERAERANEKAQRGVRVCLLSGVGVPAKRQTLTSRYLLERKAGTERKPASVSWHVGRRVACRPERSACL